MKKEIPIDLEKVRAIEMPIKQAIDGKCEEDVSYVLLIDHPKWGLVWCPAFYDDTDKNFYFRVTIENEWILKIIKLEGMDSGWEIFDEERNE